jgi:hypothetical protein
VRVFLLLALVVVVVLVVVVAVPGALDAPHRGGGGRRGLPPRDLRLPVAAAGRPVVRALVARRVVRQRAARGRLSPGSADQSIEAALCAQNKCQLLRLLTAKR